MSSVEKQFHIDMLREQRKKAKNIHEKDMWAKRIHLTEKGICWLCERLYQDKHPYK